MIELAATEPDPDAPLVDFCKVRGQVLRVSARPRVNIALAYFNDLQTVGPVAAEMALLRRTLGPEQFATLAAFEGLQQEHLDQLAQAATTLALGGAPESADGPGNASSGPES